MCVTGVFRELRKKKEILKEIFSVFSIIYFFIFLDNLFFSRLNRLFIFSHTQLFTASKEILKNVQKGRSLQDDEIKKGGD